MGSSGVVKEIHAKGEAAFVAEFGGKVRVWWNQSGNSEAAKMKSAWFEAVKKRANIQNHKRIRALSELQWDLLDPHTHTNRPTARVAI
jgi:hypothetical protein